MDFSLDSIDVFKFDQKDYREEKKKMREMLEEERRKEREEAANQKIQERAKNQAVKKPTNNENKLWGKLMGLYTQESKKAEDEAKKKPQEPKVQTFKIPKIYDF